VSCEGNWRRASKLATSHQDELHRVSVDHEDQATGEESLRGHRVWRCHAAGGPNDVGRHHQRGVTGDADIARGEGDCHRDVRDSQIFADQQRDCPKTRGRSGSVSRTALSKFTAAAERLLCKIRSITRTTSIVLREGVQSNRAHA
jgi:hypothetical protein